MDQVELASKQLAPMEKSLSTFAEQSFDLQVADDQSAALMGDIIKHIRAIKKSISAKRLSITRPMDLAKKNVMALFKAPEDRCDAAIEDGQKKQTDYLREQERIRVEAENLATRIREAQEKEERERVAAEAAEAQRIADEEAAEARRIADEKAAELNAMNLPGADEVVADAEAEALSIEESGQVEVEAIEAAPVVLPPAAAPPPKTEARGNVSNTHVRKTWKAEVYSLREVCLGVAEGRIPPEVLGINKGALAKHARDTAQATSCDGIKIYQDIQAVTK